MASLDGYNDTCILNAYKGYCALVSLGGGALSPLLHVLVAI